MEQQFCILRVAKLTTWGNVAASGMHTWRERETKNADPARRARNVDLREVHDAETLAARIRERIALAGKNVAEKPVLAIEYFVGRSPDASVDDSAYLRDALAWIEAKHGAENVVAATIHRDEKTPHMAVYVVPLVQTQDKVRKRSVIVGTNPDGSKRRETREFAEQGSCKLSASHFVDGKGRLSAMQTSFAKAVGARYGLLRGVEGSKARHEAVKRFYGALEVENEMPTVDVPSAGFLEGKAEYGKRVAASVLEQLQPEWQAMKAKAAMYVAEKDRHRETARRDKAVAEREMLERQLERTSEMLDSALKRQDKMKADYEARIQRADATTELYREGRDIALDRAREAERQLENRNGYDLGSP